MSESNPTAPAELAHYVLVRWLGEQFDEDERIARAASAGPWEKRVGYISGGPAGRVRVTQQAQAWNADHIVAHNPSRVLREIDAKRRIVAEHDLYSRKLGERMDCQSYDYPCLTLRLVALPYTDRPGYREEWRP